MANRVAPIALTALVVLTAAATACGAEADESGAIESNHTEGRPTESAFKWRWADDSLEDATRGGFASYLPQTDPLVVRLQYWLDAVDGFWRKDKPALMA